MDSSDLDPSKPIGSIMLDSKNIVVPCSLSTVDSSEEMVTRSLAGMEQTQSSVEVRKSAEPQSTDLTSTLRTSEVFKSREEMMNWARERCLKCDTVIITQRSDAGYKGRSARVLLGCERGGEYRVAKKGASKIKKERKGSTKRIGCPFQLRGVECRVGDTMGWKLEVMCGYHNHPPGQFREGHSFAGRLKENEKEVLKDMTAAGFTPSHVLQTLRKKDPSNCTTIQTIYNARQAMRLTDREGRSHLQELMKKVEESGYVCYHRKEDETNIFNDIFFAHPMSIQLANIFPRVFIIDCTYKTNKFTLPILSIVGITSTYKKFYTGFAFISSELESSYVWTLEIFKSLFKGSEKPLVFVTDREQTLMNAIEKVFPGSHHMLCVSHISTDLFKNCRKAFETNVVWDEFLRSWNGIVYSTSESKYEEAVVQLDHDYRDYPEVIKYIHSTWLERYKECFVSAWTDQYLHFGNKASNIVESAHAPIKCQLRSSIMDLLEWWHNIDNIMNLQHIKVKASFEESRLKRGHQFRTPFYKEVIGFVSKVALELIEKERSLVEQQPVIESECRHELQKTHGLPCKHQLSMWLREGHPLPLSEIHVHWRTLYYVRSASTSKGVDLLRCFEKIIERYERSDAGVQDQINRQLHELADPTSTTMVDPLIPLKTHDSKINRFSGNGVTGFSDGDSTASAMFDHPRSFAQDAKGKDYVADKNNHAIRKVSRSGVTTIAGGYSKKTGNTDGPAQNASFSDDFDLVFVPKLCALLISD